MAKAYLVVRSVVEESLRERFDAWYRTEHVPLVMKTYGAVSASRYWSNSDPAVHFILIEFPDLETAQARLTTAVVTFMAEDFETAWPHGVTRTRELISEVQCVGASTSD
jgi:hypothetical protein